MSTASIKKYRYRFTMSSGVSHDITAISMKQAVIINSAIIAYQEVANIVRGSVVNQVV